MNTSCFGSMDTRGGGIAGQPDCVSKHEIIAYCHQGSGVTQRKEKTCTSHKGVWFHLNVGALEGFMQENNMIRLEI